MTSIIGGGRPAAPHSADPSAEQSAVEWGRLHQLAAAQWSALAPLLAQAPTMRLSSDGGQSFPARGQRRLSDRLPAQPATIAVYDPHAGTGRLLACDFDVARARAAGAGDPAARVAADAAAFAALIKRVGGHPICDISPARGRHVYVLFARPLPWWELRQISLALARRYASLDAVPMCSRFGQIRPPGAAHKLARGRLSGWIRLDMPLREAERAASRPAGPAVWNALCTELTAELAALAPATTLDGADDEGLALDDDDLPWLPRPGGRRAPHGRLAELAATGQWAAHGYASASEARLAVLNAAAAGGWRLAELADQMRPGGPWAGLAALLERRRPANRRQILRRDWHKACADAKRERSARNPNTRGSPSTPPRADQSQNVWGLPVHRRTPAAAGAAAAPALSQHQQIRRWWQAVWIAERDRSPSWGRRGLSIRRVLRALGAAAQMTASTVVAFGTRALSLMTGLDYTTVATTLAYLRDEPHPLIERIARARRQQADSYLLTIPDPYAELAAWRRWRPGNIAAIHPCFHTQTLGGTAALVYEALSTVPTRLSDLQTIAHLSASATSAALHELAAHGLADRDAAGWRRGPAALDQVAEQIGAADQHAERLDRYREHRSHWWRRLGIITDLQPPDPADYPPEQIDAELDALLVVRNLLGGRVVRGPPAQA